MCRPALSRIDPSSLLHTSRISFQSALVLGAVAVAGRGPSLSVGAQEHFRRRMLACRARRSGVLLGHCCEGRSRTAADRPGLPYKARHFVVFPYPITTARTASPPKRRSAVVSCRNRGQTARAAIRSRTSLERVRIRAQCRDGDAY
jgi:hypothetical protein